MKVKKYYGETIQDTIFKVKVDLGPDAIILDTRKLKVGGFLGFFAEEKVEVLAALEDEQTPVDDSTKEDVNDLKQMVKELSNNIDNKMATHATPDELKPLRRHLLDQELKEQHVNQTIDTLYKDKHLNEDNLKEKVKDYYQEIIGQPKPIEVDRKAKVITFIGPTGVGKTTTIAKIAAMFVIKENLNVGLITADTYRIAAVQQLKTYSDIINIPLKVANDGSEFKEAVGELSQEADLILVDTPGRNWKDKFEVGQLNEFIKNRLVDEVHLILSMNMSSKDLEKTIHNFNHLYPNKILLTKLDETSSYGDIINIRNEFKKPFSYITFGQEVPEDIDVAKPEILTNYLMGDFDEQSS